MQTKIPGYRSHLATTAVLLVLAAAIFLGCLYAGGGLPTFGSSYRIKAVLPTVSTLVSGSRVTMSGAEVGTVKAVKRDGLGAVVTLELTKHSVYPIPSDSTIRLRQHTPVGEDYVSIDPGTAKQTLPSGATLPMKQAGDFVDVDQVLSTLSGPAQQRARDLIQSTGEAVGGRGDQLNQLVGGVNGTIIPFADVVHTGYTDRRQVAQLVQQLGNLGAAIGERQSAVDTTAREGLISIKAIGDKDQALGRLIDTLPATLKQVQQTSRTVAQVTGTATPVLEQLAAGVREVRPAVRNLRPAAQQGRSVVAQLRTAAPALRGTLSQVRTLSAPATKALPALHQTLCQLNPMVRYLEPYTNDVIATLTGLGSAANSYDAVGHVIRLVPLVSENELAGLPAPVSDAAFKLLNAGVLGKLRPISFNPYPKPGQIGKRDQITDPVNGPAGLKASGFVYPHVNADC